VCTTKQYSPGGSGPLETEARFRERLAATLAKAWSEARATGNQPLQNLVFGWMRGLTAHSHANPLFVLTNRCYVLEGSANPTYPGGLSVEKKYVSNEDFIVNLYSGVFAEEEVSYVTVDDSYGEDKRSPFDSLSVFGIGGITFGVEICLDHADYRLRKHMRDSSPVQVQVVTSCGMQIKQSAIAAVEGGLVFNCDGQYGAPGRGLLPGRSTCLWTSSANQMAHSQLTVVSATATSPFEPEHPSRGQASVVKPDLADAEVFHVARVNTRKLWAHGAGEIHVYEPLAVPPVAGSTGRHGHAPARLTPPTGSA
jgi:hypothetical protein